MSIDQYGYSNHNSLLALVQGLLKNLLILSTLITVFLLTPIKP